MSAYRRINRGSRSLVRYVFVLFFSAAAAAVVINFASLRVVLISEKKLFINFVCVFVCLFFPFTFDLIDWLCRIRHF